MHSETSCSCLQIDQSKSTRQLYYLFMAYLKSALLLSRTQSIIKSALLNHFYLLTALPKSAYLYSIMILLYYLFMNLSVQIQAQTNSFFIMKSLRLYRILIKIRKLFLLLVCQSKASVLPAHTCTQNCSCCSHIYRNFTSDNCLFDHIVI